jgi:opacity protein-like surface antigen
MTRNLKVLGLALVAAFALTAVMASAASAQFTSNLEPTVLSGTQKTGTLDKFTAGSGFSSITCETATFAGEAKTKSVEFLDIAPTYSNCKDSLGRVVDIVENTLNYRFTSGSGVNGGTKGQVDITGKIKMTATPREGSTSECTIVIEGPQNVGGVTYTNLGGTKGIEVTTHATGIKSTLTGIPSLFGGCGVFNASQTNGTYDGTAIVTGKSGGTAAELSVD